MSGDWTTVLGVLLIGAVAGGIYAWRVRRESSGSSGRGSSDVALELKDLHRRRDELYARLEASEEPADRRILEEQAARVLRDIDRLEGAAGGSRAPRPEPARKPSDTPARAGRPMLVGFLGGAAMVALVGTLIWLAVRDAEPREDVAPPGPAMSRSEEHPEAPVPPEAAERLAALRARAEADPTDLVARKQLALALLAAEQYFEAFEITNEILRARPDDPDGLYVQGMVRMTMGQDEEALNLLDRVLEQYPNHILALAGRGMVFMRSGDVEAARIVWQRALEAAGGSHPDLEELIAMTDHATPGAAPPLAPGATLPGSRVPQAVPEPAPRSETASGSTAPAPVGGGYVVRVELGSNTASTPGATLFVFLSQGEGGPPAAVRRIPDPRFPVDVTLSPSNSMLGRPLPPRGLITARLDADGSASTRDEGDLAASAEASVGEALTLTLGN